MRSINIITKLLFVLAELGISSIYCQKAIPIVSYVPTVTQTFYCLGANADTLYRAFQLGLDKDSNNNSLFIEKYSTVGDISIPVLEIKFDSVVIVRGFAFDVNSNTIAIAYSNEIYTELNGKQVGIGWTKGSIIRTIDLNSFTEFECNFDSSFEFYCIYFNSLGHLKVIGSTQVYSNKFHSIPNSPNAFIGLWSVIGESAECDFKVLTGDKLSFLGMYYITGNTYLCFSDSSYFVKKVSDLGVVEDLFIPTFKGVIVDIAADSEGKFVVATRHTKNLFSKNKLIGSNAIGDLIWENTIKVQNIYDIRIGMHGMTYILASQKHGIRKKVHQDGYMFIAIDSMGKISDTQKIERGDFRKIILSEGKIYLTK